eukprot:CAMPEP_0202452132 /NCGR_PEP_ID=MMETSP1360-20130828/10407_1 /ASSEMBLY_ACC=CAM_ASM_000848 /TAXON_ID=515479 /ORGANISM="Licmophora paradoxa, Strain CCMP2313" /LENGTH=83 /DNA_ID=CAMNT_0049070871 /DNA_START=351 /DNA_END=602 /DNA_ORIENTATION=-
MTSPSNNVWIDPEYVGKDGLIGKYVSSGFDLSKDFDKGIRACRSVHDGFPLDDEFGDSVDTEVVEALQGVFDFGTALVGIEEL